MVVAVAVAAAVVVLAVLVGLVRAILRSPNFLSRHLRNRRGERAYEAISNGLIAIGAGDIEAAKKHAAAVNRLAPHEPLALLLNAQSAQLAGDREAAERTFRAMAGRADTKPLGLHGLFIEARRRNDAAGARAYAEEAARTAPSLHWANRAVLEALCRDGDWAGALALLENNMRTLERSVYRRTARRLADGACPRLGTYRPRRRQGGRAWKRRNWRRLWCRRRRSPGGCSPKAASFVKLAASSTPPGAPIRIRRWRRPMPSCAPANRRASG